MNFHLSWDERRVAVSKRQPGLLTDIDIWVIDLARGDNFIRLTSDPAAEADPIWSPNGLQVLYNSDRDRTAVPFYNSAFRRAADGTGPEVPVTQMSRLFESPDWSHNGSFLVFTGDGTQPTDRDLWILPLSGDGKPTRFLRTPSSNEDSPAFSPDDRWIGYNSDDSGRDEVYVRSFPSGDRLAKISHDGGWAPRWRGDGKEIFFLAPDGTMMAADVTLGKEVQPSVPRPLFRTSVLKNDTDRHLYAVTRDGKRFLLLAPEQTPAPITVVLNWPAMW